MDGWTTVEVDRLSQADVRALLDNRIAAIRRPGFLDEDACARSRPAIVGSEAWGYYEGAYPRAGRLGISLYEHYEKKDAYFEKAPSAIKLREECMKGLPDPQELLLEELREVWDGPVEIAEEDGAPYFSGIFRMGSGAAPHTDWGPRDAPDWTVGGVLAQLAWNLYYTLPGEGGELIVHNHPWQPGLDDHARQRFYDYERDAFAGAASAKIKPRVGELVIFNARNVHEVADARGTDDGRLATSSFVGELEDGRLILWS